MTLLLGPTLLSGAFAVIFREGILLVSGNFGATRRAYTYCSLKFYHEYPKGPYGKFVLIVENNYVQYLWYKIPRSTYWSFVSLWGIVLGLSVNGLSR